MKMRLDHLDEVYRENDMLRAQCMSLDAMVDENIELKRELEETRKMNVDQKAEEMAKENARLRKRNGELLIKSSDLEDENKVLKDKIEYTKKPSKNKD